MLYVLNFLCFFSEHNWLLKVFVRGTKIRRSSRTARFENRQVDVFYSLHTPFSSVFYAHKKKVTETGMPSRTTTSYRVRISSVSGLSTRRAILYSPAVEIVSQPISELSDREPAVRIGTPKRQCGSSSARSYSR